MVITIMLFKLCGNNYKKVTRSTEQMKKPVPPIHKRISLHARMGTRNIHSVGPISEKTRLSISAGLSTPRLLSAQLRGGFIITTCLPSPSLLFVTYTFDLIVSFLKQCRFRWSQRPLKKQSPPNTASLGTSRTGIGQKAWSPDLRATDGPPKPS